MVNEARLKNAYYGFKAIRYRHMRGEEIPEYMVDYVYEELKAALGR